MKELMNKSRIHQSHLPLKNLITEKYWKQVPQDLVIFPKILDLN